METVIIDTILVILLKRVKQKLSLLLNYISLSF